jgi:opacity protein-like surface antigen
MRTLLAAVVATCLLASVADANPYGRYGRGSYGGYQNGYGNQGWYGQGGTQVNVYPQSGYWLGPGQLNYWQNGYGNYWPQQGPPRAYYRQQYKLNTSPGWDW